MISMRRRLLLMLALILLVTQLISAFWLWHESREQISFLVDETLSAKVRSERVDTEIAEAIASLLAPSLIMMIVTLLASFWAISWITRPLNQLQQRLEKRSADNLTPLPINSDSPRWWRSPMRSISCSHGWTTPSSRSACSPPTRPTSCARRWPAFACIWN